MEQNNNEKITMEDLAGMVKRGFDRIDERFEKVDKRFDRVDTDIKKVSKDVTDLSYKVTQIDKRLFSLEEDIYVNKKKQLEKLEGRVSFVERKLGVEATR